MEFSSPEIAKAVGLIIALMVAIIGHEIMHGYAALKFGDTTAKEAKRLTINPIKHIDPIGTIVVPALLYFGGAPFLFGWAKPVPVDVATVIRNGGYGGAITVSLAGIAYNFALAAVAAVLFSIMMQTQPQSLLDAVLLYFVLYLIVYNVVLGFFNLWPLPPLDGSHALGYASLWLGKRKLPELLNRIEPYGFIILLIILATPLSEIFFYPVRWVLAYLI